MASNKKAPAQKRRRRAKLTLDQAYYTAETFHEYGVLFPARTIYFGSEYYPDAYDGSEAGVDFESSKRAIKNLLLLDYMDTDLITIYWNSLGGCWFRGMAIYDVIQQIKSPVRFIGLGMVRSMGTIIMQACTERLLTPNCDFMIHDGSTAFEGETRTGMAWAEHDKVITDRMYEIYLTRIHQKHPDFKKDKIRDMCSHDFIMSSREAVNLGLADKVIRTPQKIVMQEFEKPGNTWHTDMGVK